MWLATQVVPGDLVDVIKINASEAASAGHRVSWPLFKSCGTARRIDHVVPVCVDLLVGCV